MKNTRVVFYGHYYTLKAIKKTDKYRKLGKKIHNEIKDLGYPIPTGGFKNSKEYLEWIVPFEKAVNNNPRDYAKVILRAFNLDTNNEELLHGIILSLFFNINDLPIKPTIGFLPEVDITKGQINLSLTIFPWTTKEDFESLEIWKDVEMLRSENTLSKTKNKEWKNFERDLKVFTLYQRAQQDIKKGLSTIITPHTKTASKSVYDKLKTYTEFGEIEKHYKNLDDEVRAIISRCKCNFGSLKLL